MPPLLVRRLHLVGPRSRVARARTVVEDALHTASLPLGRPGALLVVRRLDLGLVDPDRPSQALAPKIEQLVRELARAAAPAASPEAREAPAVWFRDAVAARVALIVRVVRGPAPTEWYWAPAVGGWREVAAAPAVAPLLEAALVEPVSPEIPAPVRVAVLIVELARAGVLPEVLAVAGPTERWCAPLMFAVQRESVRAPEIAVPDLPRLSPTVAAAVAAVEARWGATSPAARLTKAAVTLVERPSLPVRPPSPRPTVTPTPGGRPALPLPTAVEDPAVPVRVAAPAPVRVVPPEHAPSATPPPSPRPPLRPPEQPEAVTGPPPREVVVAGEPAGEGQLGARSASSTPPEWRAGRRIDPSRGRLHLPDLDGEPLLTAWAGVFFTLPLLARLGLPDAMVAGVDPTFGWWVLAALLERVGAHQDDGLALLVARLLSDERPPDAVLDAWTDAVAAAWHARSDEGLDVLMAGRGVVVATPTHVDVLLDHGALRMAVRRHALDTDPGWVPWLGKVVAFHYVESGEFAGLWEREASAPTER